MFPRALSVDQQRSDDQHAHVLACIGLRDVATNVGFTRVYHASGLLVRTERTTASIARLLTAA